MIDRLVSRRDWDSSIEEARFYSYDLAKFIAAKRTAFRIFILIAALFGVGCASAGYFTGRNMAIAAWSHDELKSWMLSARGGTPEQIEFAFRDAASLEMEEAVPKAVLYACRDAKNADGSLRFHVLAARDLLMRHDFADIERIVRRDAVMFTDPNDVLRRLQEVLE